MRPLKVIYAILLLSAAGSCQNAIRGFAGYCPYGCGPYIPLITTPMLSFATASANPAGATNATGGLFAGATNSTLSEVSDNLDAVHTVPVWYSGGGVPVISSAVNALAPEMPMGRVEPMRPQPEASRQAWTYFRSAEQTASPVQAATAAQGLRRAARTYSDADVQRQNLQNGLVKYDNKTLKIQ
jgi:hypothetical protein